MYIYVYTYVYTYACMFVYIRIHIHIYVCMCMYTYIYIYIYRVYQKKCLELKIASKSDIFQKFGSFLQLTESRGLLLHPRQKISFKCGILFPGGNSKCLIFTWLAQKNIKLKIKCFSTASISGRLLLICKNFRKIDA